MEMTLFERFLRSWRVHMVRPFIKNGSRVLDIGSQEGALFRKWKKQKIHGVGIDPLISSEKFETYELIQGKFPDSRLDGPFDSITMLAVFEHFPPEQVAGVVSECHRLLVPGGVLAMTVPDQKVDKIIHWLMKLRLINGLSHEEHHGFDPRTVPSFFPSGQWRKVKESSFQLGLNNVFVFEKK